MSARNTKGNSKVSQTKKPKEVRQLQNVPPKVPAFFPFARYTSIVGVHTSLLAFTALFLPKTTLSSIVNPQAASPVGKSLRSLTENPLQTVAWMCVGAFILQGWWAGWLRGWSLEGKELVSTSQESSEDATARKLRRKEWDSGRVGAFYHAFLATVVGSVALSIVSVLFGAPVHSHHLHTFALSLLISFLTIFTPAYTLGVPSLKSDTESLVRRLTWIRLFAEISPRSPVERAIVYPAVGTFLGTWVGVIPIGLDWERPWQRWPLPTAYGAVSGYIVGSLIALAVSAIQHLAEVDRHNRALASSQTPLTQPSAEKKTKAS